ncbi:beta 1-4 rhamnosyltransferase Cps2T [Candidatus Galacturonibacter soehngenii]|uniref:Glycosyltransferase family 1 protein n=1 Tax=Candidatus Galacturonatibacter soehngenii TaxID=2307010 RepID=A0A7V7QKD9_9FIRM|nr:DUF1972 domain-containing protein [Candidatus Galacturonibacter soehngenii]KAB1438249.1 glycosyltransferase family 1 protein [Candidatus Galacturonibacter soehngenii]
MQHVFIVGSKGIPGAYGGYETFVDKLTEYHQNNSRIKYHVACKGRDNLEFEYNNARCFKIKVPNIGSAQAIYYDLKALSECCKYIKKNNIDNPIVYVLACRIGPFALHFKRKLHKLGGSLYINPDGHEWKRAKWSLPIRMYWKFSEKMMVKQADLVICDSINIEKYIQDTYKQYSVKTKYIAYGAETKRSIISDDNPKLIKWYHEKGIVAHNYYLIVGRFVRENNYETIICEFMKSNSNKDLVIITTANDTLMDMLENKLHFKSDKRIKFVGTVYDQELLRKIRENAYGYLHGHEVGGTNPSLLEALSSTNLNLLLDVNFNREVGSCAAIYWSKEQGDLSKLIDKADKMNNDCILQFGISAKTRIKENYSWEYIVNCYEEVFLCKI